MRRAGWKGNVQTVTAALAIFVSACRTAPRTPLDGQLAEDLDAGSAEIAAFAPQAGSASSSAG